MAALFAFYFCNPGSKSPSLFAVCAKVSLGQKAYDEGQWRRQKVAKKNEFALP